MRADPAPAGHDDVIYSDANEQTADWASHAHLPHMPSVDDLRARAEAMYARTPSMDEIVARARTLLVERVSLRLAQLEGLAPA